MATTRLHRRHRRRIQPGLDRHSGIVPWALNGLVVGLPAGAFFILFEMFMSGFSNPTLFGPLRLIGAIVLGQGALTPQPATEAGTAIIVGFIVHVLLAAVFGAILGVSLWVSIPLSRSRAALTGAAAVGGVLLWLVNFYVIAPVAFPWFTTSSPRMQSVAHTVFYGAAYGLLLATRLRSTERASGGPT